MKTRSYTRKWLLCCCFFLCTVNIVAAQELLYFSGFNDREEKWPNSGIPGGATSIENGFYTIKKQSRDDVFITNDLKLDYTRNFTIETSVIHYSGSNNVSYGLAVGFKDKDNLLPFGITSGGMFHCAPFKDGKTAVPNDISPSKEVKKGNNVVNNLKLEKSGNMLFFYVNDVIVAERNAPDFAGTEIGFFMVGAQQIGFDLLRVKYIGRAPVAKNDKPKTEPATKIADVTPPVITLIKPAVTNNGAITKSEKELLVTGKATDASGIYSITANNIDAAVDEQGNFSVAVPLIVGKNTVEIIATDGKMNKQKLFFTVQRQSDVMRTAAPGIVAEEDIAASAGKYYALLIGVQDYIDPAINDLDKPFADATRLYNTLTTYYTFNKTDVFLLKNPTRDKLFEALDDLSKKVKPEDNVLIFYAGHGYWDEVRNQGYWYPSDAKKNIRTNWISNADLKEAITSVPSKHTLLITDACFAGGIFKTRSVMADASLAIQELYKLTSRKAMTSGAMKEVPDKSVFVEYLDKRLKENKQKYLSAGALFNSFRESVTNNSSVKQIPLYGEIREAGDDGGEFIFIKRP